MFTLQPVAIAAIILQTDKHKSDQFRPFNSTVATVANSQYVKSISNFKKKWGKKLSGKFRYLPPELPKLLSPVQTYHAKKKKIIFNNCKGTLGSAALSTERRRKVTEGKLCFERAKSTWILCQQRCDAHAQQQRRSSFPIRLVGFAADCCSSGRLRPVCLQSRSITVAS